MLTQIHIFIYSIISIPIMAEKEDKEMEETIKKVDGNPAYKVLTKGGICDCNGWCKTQSD